MVVMIVTVGGGCDNDSDRWWLDDDRIVTDGGGCDDDR